MMDANDARLPEDADSPGHANRPDEASKSTPTPSDIANSRLAAIDCVFADVSLPEMAAPHRPLSITGDSQAAAIPYSVQVFVTGAPAPAGETTAAPAAFMPATAEVASPRPRITWVPVALFVATCVSTCLAGACRGEPWAMLNPLWGEPAITLDWFDGFCYMGAVMAILFAHEMGHYLQALRYHVPASPPYFLPIPLLTPIGTMGAVIKMQGGRADRKQLFDIGISGPLAGLVLAVPIALYGIATAQTVSESTLVGRLLQNPWFFQSVESWLRTDIADGMVLDRRNPFWMAGWVGMLITGLNMLPLSQLDGGHISYALLGKRAHLLARCLLLCIAIFILRSDQYAWCLMFVLVMVIGADHPPTANDHVPLGWKRKLLGWLSLAIPIFCLAPVPVL